MRKVWLLIACLPVCASLLVAAPAYAVAALQDFSLAPNPILSSGTSFGTVTLSEPAASDTVVTLVANPANTVSMQASVTVPTGQSQASFQIDAQGTPSTTTISATLGAVTLNRDLDIVAALPHLVLNEVDYDQPGTDGGEFVELFNAGDANASLANLAVVLANGADNSEYQRYDLDSLGCLAAGGYLVLRDPGVTVTPGALVLPFATSTNSIQNGSPDGVALVDTSQHTVLDALSYEGDITAAALTGFPGTVSLVEGISGLSLAAVGGEGADGTSLGSLRRHPDGTDTNDTPADWEFGSAPTPGGPLGGGASSVPGVCNHPPELAAIGDRAVTAGQVLAFTVSATDPDGDTLAYAATNLPPGASFDSATQSFSWTPSAAQVGKYAQVHFSVSDGTAAPVAEDIAITVTLPPPGGGGEATGSTSSGLPATPAVIQESQVPATPAAAAPDTRIAKVKVKKRTARVTFTGSGGARAFQCKLDKGRFKACRSPKAFRRLAPGRHVLQVRAVNSAGAADPTPAKKKFVVKR